MARISPILTATANSSGISSGAGKLTDLSRWLWKCLIKFDVVAPKTFILMLHILQVAIILFD